MFKFAAIILSTLLSHSLSAETILFVADNWCPYNCNSKSEQEGYIVDILREVFEKDGTKVEYKLYPWARALKMIHSDEADGIIGTSPSELDIGIFPKNHIGVYAPHFILRKEALWEFENLKSLNDLVIGAVDNYNYGKFQEYIQSKKDSKYAVKIFGDNVTERALKLLIKGQIDTFIEDPTVALYDAKKLNIQGKIQLVSNKDTPKKLFVGFSPKDQNSKTYAKILSDGIDRLRKSGKLAEILNKYGLGDWIKYKNAK